MFKIKSDQVTVRAVVVAATALALGGLSLHAQEGVKQVETLIKKSTATVKSIDETKAAIQKSVDAYNLVIAPGTTNRKSAYSKLQKEMESTEKKRGEVPKRIDEANAEADTLFKSWSASTAGISDADLRTKSEKRLADAKARYGDIQTANKKAGELYTAFMKTLQDHVTFLGHDLNDSAVASLKPEAEKVNAQAKELYAAIDQATTAANTNIAALAPKS